jgi:YcxB-like protein
MPEQPSFSIFVKLRYWESYRLNVAVTQSALSKVLSIWAFFALLWFALMAFSIFRRPHGQEWARIMQNAQPLQWAFGLPILFIFVLPLLSARRLLRDELLKRGVGYVISEAGIHVDTSVSKGDLSWAAIYRVEEEASGFVIFTSPRIAFMLPKRCLESEEAIDALRELFRAHVPKASLRRS